MEQHRIKSEEFIPLAKELKSKRKEMGLKAIDVCRSFNLNQPNYSRMESGLLNPSPVINYIRLSFDKWRKGRIKELKQEISRLEKLS